MSAQTETPRTDGIPQNGAFHHWRMENVFAMCRTLERELNAMTACAERLADSLKLNNLCYPIGCECPR